MTNLRRVNRKHPCPVCGRPDWCCITADGELIYCMRVPSERPCTTGNGGWFHWLKPDGPVRVPPPTPSGPTPDFEPLAKKYIESLYAWTGQREAWCDLLGVSAGATMRLLMGHDDGIQTFPMKDAAAKIIGIRLRDPRTADKWCVKGSREGLFIPCGFNPRKACTIVEGPTDCAAAIDMGFNAIGRPSCVGGARILVEIVRKWKTPACLIIMDNDEEKTRPDGSKWRPGHDGANTLMLALMEVCERLSLVEPPEGIKDIRQWKQQGGTKHDVLARLQVRHSDI